MVTAMYEPNLVHMVTPKTQTIIVIIGLEDMRWDEKTVVLLHVFQLVALETSKHHGHTILLNLKNISFYVVFRATVTSLQWTVTNHFIISTILYRLCICCFYTVCGINTFQWHKTLVLCTNKHKPGKTAQIEESLHPETFLFSAWEVFNTFRTHAVLTGNISKHTPFWFMGTSAYIPQTLTKYQDDHITSFI